MLGSSGLFGDSYQPPDKLESTIDLLQLSAVGYLYGKSSGRAHAIGFKRYVCDAGLFRAGSSRQHIADELHPVETNDFKNSLPVGRNECGGIH